MSATSANPAAIPATVTTSAVELSPAEALTYRKGLSKYDDEQGQKNRVSPEADQTAFQTRQPIIRQMLDYLRFLGEESQRHQDRVIWLTHLHSLVQGEREKPTGIASESGWSGFRPFADCVEALHRDIVKKSEVAVKERDNPQTASLSYRSLAKHTTHSYSRSFQSTQPEGPEKPNLNQLSVDQRSKDAGSEVKGAITDMQSAAADGWTGAGPSNQPSRAPSPVFTSVSGANTHTTIPTSPATTQQSGRPERKA